MPKCDFNKVTKHFIELHFDIDVLLLICCIFSQHLFLRTPLGDCFGLRCYWFYFCMIGNNFCSVNNIKIENTIGAIYFAKQSLILSISFFMLANNFCSFKVAWRVTYLTLIWLGQGEGIFTLCWFSFNYLLRNT